MVPDVDVQVVAGQQPVRDVHVVALVRFERQSEGVQSKPDQRRGDGQQGDGVGRPAGGPGATIGLGRFDHARRPSYGLAGGRTIRTPTGGQSGTLPTATGQEMGVITFSLQSGSNGNAIYVEAAGVRLLFDAGISGISAQRRMAEHGRDIRTVDALILSHDHSDHVRCAGIYQRKFGLPIYLTRTTHRAIWCDLGELTDVRYFRSGEALEFGPVTVHTMRTPHDAADAVVFVVECDRRRLGIFTDLGHPFDRLARTLEDLDAAYLESNYDPQMLEDGPYPPHLKARIRGVGGHLSNAESARLVQGCGAQRPRWIALAHLSEQNNEPDVALATHRELIGKRYPLHMADRDGVSRLLRV